MPTAAPFLELDTDRGRSAAIEWLHEAGCARPEHALAAMRQIVDSRVTEDLLATLGNLLAEHLPQTIAPEIVLERLADFILAVRSPTSLLALFERDVEALPTLLRIFSLSDYLSQILIADPDGFDLLRVSGGQPVARDILVDELAGELNHASGPRQTLEILEQFRRRETMRIAYGDFIRSLPIERTTEQLSFVVDAIVDGTLRWVRRAVAQHVEEPLTSAGKPARLTVLGLGRLGGQEISYDSALELVFLSEPVRAIDSFSQQRAEHFFTQIAVQTLELLSNPEAGPRFNVDGRRRPYGARGPLVISTVEASRYYDARGRTWDRQGFIKARPVAGNEALGNEFLSDISSWVYRHYLNPSDITGVQALQRKILHQAGQAERETTNVMTGHGGIREIEFVVQFLQLLNGGDLPPIRVGNTLRAIAALEQVGFLTMQERTILTDNYTRLRRVQHHLQVMFGLDQNRLPNDEAALQQLAWQLGHRRGHQTGDPSSLRKMIDAAFSTSRKVLEHLMHDVFGGSDSMAAETVLVLDPEPDPQAIEKTFSRYRFRYPQRAFEHLMRLSLESIPFLSTRRCRHFLAAIAPNLLAEIGRAPDPDATLRSLVEVSDSLGGKGALWELFRTAPAALRMVVRLCACSPYLSRILTKNPGMIDELMDSLLLDRLPTLEELDETSKELCRGAVDIDPILRSFKNSVHLRVGVRDILGKETIRSTHRTLADAAEVCLRRVVEFEKEQLARRFGDPCDAQGNPVEMVLIGFGKLGGREPNYHSDLDVAFLYERDGQTQRRVGGPRSTTSNSHFFNALTQKILQRVHGSGAADRLYEIDANVRPASSGGIQAMSYEQFGAHFRFGAVPVWQQMALHKARPVCGSDQAQRDISQLIKETLCSLAWTPQMAEEIVQMREQLAQTASPENFKRGPGGTLDVEWAAQILQMRNAAKQPEVLATNTFDALEKLSAAGRLDSETAALMAEGYRMLRALESNLRLLDTSARHELPTDEEALQQLSFLMDDQDAQSLGERTAEVRRRNRQLFDQIVGTL